MIALADVFRSFAQDYLLTHGASVLPSHHPPQAPQIGTQAQDPPPPPEFMRRFLQHVLPKGLRPIKFAKKTSS